MIRQIALGATAVLVLGAATIDPVEAGCLKGAVVGGVAGHVANHHAVIGAIAGCAVGHHVAVVKKREEEQRNAPVTNMDPRGLIRPFDGRYRSGLPDGRLNPLNSRGLGI